METYKFKTSLKCAGCLKTITPILNDIKEIEYWEVHLEDENKILEIEAASDISEAVTDAIKKAGFEISRLD